MKFFGSRGLQSAAAGLSVVHQLPDHISDISVAEEARKFGLAPAPLSTWYTSPESQRQGLLLNVAAVPDSHIFDSCERLYEIVSGFS